MHSIIQHLLNQYGYFGVFFIFFTEMIGAPFPAETTLTLCGFELSSGTFSFTPLWLIVTCGNIVGSSMAYAIGYQLGYPIILRYGRFVGITYDRLKKAENKFLKHRRSIILFGKFVSGIRVITPFLAGISHMSFVRFTLYNTISAIGWSAFYILEGRYLGQLWNQYHYLFQQYEFVAIVVVCCVVFSIIWVKISIRHRIRKNKQNVQDSSHRRRPED